MSSGGTHLRDMTIDDCEAVARVRVRGWQSAYAGMIPQAHLDAMSVEEDAARRRAHLAEAEAEAAGTGAGAGRDVVAERDGQVIGWGCYGPYRDEGEPAAGAELYALYVLPEHRSTGAGRALTAELLARAATDGHPRMLLWVLTENTLARRFYEKAGFAPDGAETSSDVRGVAVPETRYARRLSAADAAAVRRG
ncbi:GNAT family N-acetyltransferase [Streptomyces sp. Wb2n-11]|uniref:GNAT family N-acetyltransferase n=1 Tax=Streptomyces sp. Wb2n-11 TaxID=1030533 RepID=UPI0021006609|nr:GNAT family N-acetyltransferase [Streptomyces sp. Wb2n-11]